MNAMNPGSSKQSTHWTGGQPPIRMRKTGDSMSFGGFRSGPNFNSNKPSLGNQKKVPTILSGCSQAKATQLKSFRPLRDQGRLNAGAGGGRSDNKSNSQSAAARGLGRVNSFGPTKNYQTQSREGYLPAVSNKTTMRQTAKSNSQTYPKNKHYKSGGDLKHLPKNKQNLEFQPDQIAKELNVKPENSKIAVYEKV